MVTLDEIGEFDDLHLTTRVNGELRQDDTPASMAYPIEFQIAYLSTFCTLEPGDLIFTGTPTGAGARFDPPRFLRPGDRRRGRGAGHRHAAQRRSAMSEVGAGAGTAIDIAKRTSACAGSTGRCRWR